MQSRLRKRVKDDLLMKKLIDSRKFPASEVEKNYCVSRKVIRKNEKFIIAVCLVLMSNNDIIKSYVYNLLKEVD